MSIADLALDTFTLQIVRSLFDSNLKALAHTD